VIVHRLRAPRRSADLWPGNFSMMHRVLLLTLTTGLFAVVWSNDQPRRGAAGETRAASRAENAAATSLCSAAADVSAGVVRTERGFSDVTDATNATVFTSACFAEVLEAPIAAPRPRVVVDLNRDVPLVLGAAIPDPGSLPAGVYHLVSSQGDVYRIAIRGTNSDPQVGEQARAAAMRIVAARGVRWYFIHIEEPAAPIALPSHGDAALAAGAAVWMGGIVRRSGVVVAAGLDSASRNLATSFRRAKQTVSRRLDALRRSAAHGAGQMGEAISLFLRRLEQARQAAADRSGGRRS
jgi:hypothetical protein